MNRRYEYFPTSTLRAMKVALSKRGWRRLFRKVLIDIEFELLARELPAIADESGGFPCAGIEGLQ